MAISIYPGITKRQHVIQALKDLKSKLKALGFFKLAKNDQQGKSAVEITKDYVRNNIADTALIFKRGEQMYANGAYLRYRADARTGDFIYHIDGNYGDYVTRIRLSEGKLETECDCPYPGDGCKHTVAVLLDAADVVAQWRTAVRSMEDRPEPEDAPYLTPEEIRQRALDDREQRARNETFHITYGDMFAGEHLLETSSGRQYTVTLHDPASGTGHCSCPDYLTNRLGTCKHLIHLGHTIRRKKGFKTRAARERFPFVDIYWDSETNAPRLFSELDKKRLRGIITLLSRYFNAKGRYKPESLSELVLLLEGLVGDKRVRVRSSVLVRLDRYLRETQAEALSEEPVTLPADLNLRLYPYQEEGILFGLYKQAVLIGDEMGLGKTIQAIVLAIMKKQLFGFTRVMVITLASLKEQWKREIDKFTSESAVVIAGTPQQRHSQYLDGSEFFKITNYEAVLRDITLFSRYKPDIIILDEAQRIKNFSTKTADAVKRIPRKHAMVLTGTPLENKLEDVYSIVQFLDPHLLSPLWRFAADHFMLDRKKRDKILGYRDLNGLHEKLKPLVIRRKKEEVLNDLPEQTINNYFVDLHHKQIEIHQGFAAALIPLLNKKYLTPIDLRRIMELMLKMRQVCDTTYLIDRETHISPKLKELEGIIDELVVQSNRKMVIFSEWTTMTFLIARHLSDVQIPFVELSGKIPVKKRQALIDEFTHNPDCKVFLSTDAGGTGLNLQAADCVVNFELPWNPAKLSQRIGRVNRIGQTSNCITVVNLIAKHSIEEKIYAGIQLKTDLFEGVFDGGKDSVEFSRENRSAMLSRLREMMGEEPIPIVPEPAVSEEIPEDTPHFLNPKVLNQEDLPLDITGEEKIISPEDGDLAETDPAIDQPGAGGSETSLATQPQEKMEAVLNSGMQFIGGLMEMATGQKMTATSEDGRMVKIDKTSGEVTLKFKLPGF